MTNLDKLLTTSDFNGHKNARHDDITVIITDDNIAKPYVHGFVSEMFRINPLFAKALELSEDDLMDYINYLISERCKQVNGDFHVRNRNKNMWIPDFIQYVISMIGIVEKREHGLRMIPEYTSEVIDIERATVISNKLAQTQDFMSVSRNAFPTDEFGDAEVMTTVLVSTSVRSMTTLTHPVNQLITAFLGMRLKEEAMHGILYRVQYDDLQYLTNVLASIGGKLNE